MVSWLHQTRKIMPDNIRLFIAVELPEELKRVLTEIGREIGARIPPNTVRWVKPAAMHLTLVFLGETPAGKLDAIKEAAASAAARIPKTSFRAIGLGCFPNPRRPRVVWVGVEESAGNLERLKQMLDEELEPLGFRPEKRRFSPHLTLGRVGRQASRQAEAELGQIVERATLRDVGGVDVTYIHLIRSDLRPSGAVYTTLASFPLGVTRPTAGPTD
jgi:2'-5' RNA ligase